MTRPFTGRHITIILIAFFGIIIAVNLTMARLAGSTFGGVLADNGYVANRDFAKWTEAAEAQARLGWNASASKEGGHLIVDLEAPADTRLDVVIAHPLGRKSEQAIAMRAVAPGRYSSLQPMPAGRWSVTMRLDDGDNRAIFLSEVGG